ncbi:MAG: SRPBCC family protein [Chloroflexi bacterium]|nr:SRPBCC family protein [Chloroflexota bacterium]
MATMEMNFTVRCPAADVFKALTDFESYQKWQTGVIESKILSAGPIGVGSRYRFVSEFMGQKIESEGEITEFDPPTRYAWKSIKGPFPMQESMTLESAGDSTTVKMTMTAELSGFFKLAEGLVISQGKKQFESDFQKLKGILEK